MGGLGSGATNHWWRPRKKRTVEECRSVSVSELTRRGFLLAGERHLGVWTWPLSGGASFTVRFEANLLDLADPFVLLSPAAFAETATYRVRLTVTRPRFGGVRYWFLCPLKGCGRRAGKLYLPSVTWYFGCRTCHDLTYRSCQESHKRDAFKRFMAKALAADTETLDLFFSRRRRKP